MLVASKGRLTGLPYETVRRVATASLQTGQAGRIAAVRRRLRGRGVLEDCAYALLRLLESGRTSLENALEREKKKKVMIWAAGIATHMVIIVLGRLGSGVGCWPRVGLCSFVAFARNFSRGRMAGLLRCAAV